MNSLFLHWSRVSQATCVALAYKVMSIKLIEYDFLSVTLATLKKICRANNWQGRGLLIMTVSYSL